MCGCLADSTLGRAVPKAKGFQTCVPGWDEASRDLRAGSSVLWDTGEFHTHYIKCPSHHIHDIACVTEQCGWWVPCWGALHLRLKSPQEDSLTVCLVINTPCPCLLVSLLFCLTVWGHPSTFLERKVCLWEMVSPHPVFVFVESEKLFCEALVLFVS